ncbi:TPA: pentapeptide repeat-containing protein [Salmonella enterica subsp. enterica serovar Napoli]|nr:pentapeptide repeat-containing protein [Salmonella enterica]HBC0189203.1 pentapeptide repeat-containing protein [Salmonella enterica subsp. enterica serovar Napoli]HBC0214810.1 pentapeptide repeat-containing protein [Salmonella enterica subsp. enterica serovar Napoli]
MNSADLSKILEEHKVWITSMRVRGSRADLCDADLCDADLRSADLRSADLRGAALCDADLCDADLRSADLRSAALCGADLRGADLRGADLCGADLCGANLPDLTFVILGEKYFISITNGEYVRAGCQNHTVEEWRKYSKQEIAEMDGRKALKFYPRLLDIIDFYIGKGERPDWLTSKEYADEVTG